MNQPDYDFELVRDEETFKRLQEFAKTFNHQLEPEDAKCPILIVKKDGQWIGYTQIVTAPIMFTAWHNELCKPFDTMKVVEKGVSWMKINGVLKNTLSGFVALDNDNKYFTPNHLEKLGLRRMNKEIYAPKG